MNECVFKCVSDVLTKINERNSTEKHTFTDIVISSEMKITKKEALQMQLIIHQN